MEIKFLSHDFLVVVLATGTWCQLCHKQYSMSIKVWSQMKMFAKRSISSHPLLRRIIVRNPNIVFTYIDVVPLRSIVYYYLFIFMHVW